MWAGNAADGEALHDALVGAAAGGGVLVVKGLSCWLTMMPVVPEGVKQLP
jgi:hypothetical protein